jgi:hypothetical protein
VSGEVIHRLLIDVSPGVTAEFVMNCGACRLNLPLELSMNDVVRLAWSPRDSRMHDENATHSHIEQAFRDVFRWIGEDPDRDGLRETPSRLVRAYREYFAGYRQNPEQILRKTFEETDGYDEMVVLRGVPFESHCEHHVAPSLHVQSWRPRARNGHGDEPNARLLPRQSDDPPGIFVDGAFQRRTVK